MNGEHVPMKNDMAYEAEARNKDPRFNAAMNAFWRTYHTEGPCLWRCVKAAMEATPK